MKYLIVILIILSSCAPDYPVERHELAYIYADATERVVYMNDLTKGEIVAIKYSYTLFQIEFIELLQIKRSPKFTFLYSNGCYYHN
jgi:hypothetical protein